MRFINIFKKKEIFDVEKFYLVTQLKQVTELNQQFQAMILNLSAQNEKLIIQQNIMFMGLQDIAASKYPEISDLAQSTLATAFKAVNQ